LHLLITKRIALKCYLAAALLTLGFLPLRGEAATGILALDEPAIAVKAPASVMLVAIARAGDRMVAAGEHGVIIYSDDNGVTWTQAAVPVDVTLTAIGFADSRHGWAVGNSGVILHTDDAGTSWQLQLNGLQANQLTLQAAELAVAHHSQSPGAPLAVARANHLIAQNDPKPFLSLVAFTPQRAIVFGAYRLTMVTADAGKTWADWSLNIADSLSHHLYGEAVVGHDIYVVGEAGLVFCSKDGGNNFPKVTPAGSTTLFGALGTGDGGVLVYGVAGTLYRSGNGGASWVAINMPSSANFTDAIALNSGTILLTGESGVIYISHDHGNSFTALPARLPMAVFAAAQAPDGTVLVAGDRGILPLKF
jgi:photosystem II stability/assembly factor-like uncharacterized protein